MRRDRQIKSSDDVDTTSKAMVGCCYPQKILNALHTIAQVTAMRLLSPTIIVSSSL